MYVQYGITVAIIVAVAVILPFLGDFSEWIYIGVSIGATLILIPVNYRWSRILYLYMFGGIKFNPQLSQPK